MITINSRYRLADLIALDSFMAISLRANLEFSDDVDNIMHLVIDGDTLQSITQRYYGVHPSGTTFWWALADFQQEPIIDPTVELEPGTVIVVPPLSVVEGSIYGAFDEENLEF